MKRGNSTKKNANVSGINNYYDHRSTSYSNKE